MKSIKRIDLYQLAWTKPIKQIAVDLKMEDIIIRKMCRSYDIPLPKRGYWTKVNFGKPVEIPKLSNEKFQESEIIDFKEFKNMYFNSAEKKLERRILKIKEESKSISKVLANLKSPDHLIIRAQEYFKNYKFSHWQNKESLISTNNGFININVTKKNIKRSLQVMNGFIKLVKKRGHTISVENGKTILVIRDQKFEIKLQEQCNRIKDPERSYSSRLVPNGTLYIKIVKAYGSKQWADSTYVKLEEKIPDIVAGFELLAEKQKLERIELQIYWKKMKKERAIRELIEKRKAWSKEQRSMLKTDLSNWQKYQEFKKSLESMKKIMFKKQSKLGSDWLSWAEKETKILCTESA